MLAALCRSVDHNLEEAFLGSWKSTELVWAGQSQIPVIIEVDFDDDAIAGYGMSVQFGIHHREAVRMKEFVVEGVKRLEWDGHVNRRHYSNVLKAVQKLLDGVHYYYWNPRFLGLPVAPDSKRRFRMESNGFGLALCLDEILSFDRDRFVQLERRFAKVFTNIKSIKLIQEMAYRAPVDDPKQVPMLDRRDRKGL